MAAGSLRTGRRAPTPRPPPASLPRVGVHGQIFSMTPEPRAVMTTRLVVGSSNLCDDAETPSHTGHFRTLRLRASPRRGTGACCVALKPFAFRLDPPPGRVARPAGRAPPPAGRLAPAWPRGHTSALADQPPVILRGRNDDVGRHRAGRCSTYRYQGQRRGVPSRLVARVRLIPRRRPRAYLDATHLLTASPVTRAR